VIGGFSGETDRGTGEAYGRSPNDVELSAAGSGSFVARRTKRGRPATVLLAPDLTTRTAACVETFELGRWMPVFLSSSIESASQADRRPAA
jgi:hypothetical protein